MIEVVIVLAVLLPIVIAVALGVVVYFNALAKERAEIESADIPEPYKSDKNV